MVKHRTAGVVLRYEFGGRPDARIVSASQRVLELQYLRPWHHPTLGTVLGQTITKPEMEDWREVAHAA